MPFAIEVVDIVDGLGSKFSRIYPAAHATPALDNDDAWYFLTTIVISAGVLFE